MRECDVLIMGCGVAGLTLALTLADNCRVALIAKNELEDSSSWQAQGGIAAALGEEDRIEFHVRDTVAVGAGLCHEDQVWRLAGAASGAIRWLAEMGVNFDREIGAGLHLTKEGGHSHRRIVHVADTTGKATIDALREQVRRRPNIEIFQDYIAVDLITMAKLKGWRHPNSCVGAYILDRHSGTVEAFRAPVVVLATGGASMAYLHTTNPIGATGDGIAMAWRAGCRVGNMEFNQFHPTCLYHPSEPSFLITEAIRGEGGRLLLANGERFMPRFHEAAELAPRDIVARAIDHEMKRLGDDCVFLDVSHLDPGVIASRFPTIQKKCLMLGIDISRAPIPVVPAAHYTCGGVVVDGCGGTDIAGLYAVGETGFTGVHGANRMASNSLLECVVYAQAAAADVMRRLERKSQPAAIPVWDESWVRDSDEDVIIAHNWQELRRCMWNYVGIVRSEKRLLRALHRVSLLQEEISEFYSNYRVSSDLIELRNLVLVANLIVTSAIHRKESRGLHFNLDYPDAAELARDTILTPKPAVASAGPAVGIV